MEIRAEHANPYTNQIFQEAVIRNDFAVVKLLLKYGIYPRRNERNRQGLTALQQSVLDGNAKMSILLLEAGADIEAKTSNGWTCLHIAAALGDLDILTTMVNHCADLIALTKNEELPIDLAATRDIKIKLAKEMSRVGYSELAQWYMRKLAAREGVFYVSISADRLLDLACDDNYDKSYSDAYPYYTTHCNNDEDLFVASPAHLQQSPARDSQNQRMHEPTDQQQQHQNNVWLEINETNNAKYLTYSNAYKEIIESPISDQSRKRAGTSASSSTVSPSRKTTDSVRSVNSSLSEETNGGGTLPRWYGGSQTKRSTSSSTSMQRKPSKIELHIDYTNSTEDDDADVSDPDVSGSLTSAINSLQTARVSEGDENRYVKSPKMGDHQFSPVVSENQGTMQKNLNFQRQQNNDRIKETESPEHLMNRNVRFNTVQDSSNEFCNCPNCKKMGYAFSPDIRASSRKLIHVGQQIVVSPDRGGAPINMVSSSYLHSPPSSYMRSQYYPATTTTTKHGLALTNPADYKQRKRKKKLFSGIRSIFKDSIRVQRTNETPHTEDAGILFAVSLRDRSKAKTIQERHFVRKSNSFSGSRNEYISEEVNVYPHNHVVPPPDGFADPTAVQKQLLDDVDDDVFESKWVEYRHDLEVQQPPSFDANKRYISNTSQQPHFDEASYEKDSYCPRNRYDSDHSFKVSSSEEKQISLSEGSEYHYLDGIM